ncbi:hypothetical protein PRIPAC_88365 [Pristionchus pacificus]|uniref:Uncharacterized protein n=1 Tax=Pristionchus pacificus TaxID=54126 RepID=A0A2A6CYP9_PRIPA|nr:hypothetical protein PRIPAC_88365 [Pristionchus pacificus]|eukprot:PDM83151.1 hypothetical protein PRIPAC_37544 [Pristionchus pacificus]
MVHNGPSSWRMDSVYDTMDKFRQHTAHLKQQIEEMSGMLAKNTFIRLDWTTHIKDDLELLI